MTQREFDIATALIVLFIVGVLLTFMTRPVL